MRHSPVLLRSLTLVRLVVQTYIAWYWPYLSLDPPILSPSSTLRISSHHIEGVSELPARHEDAAEDDVEGEAQHGHRRLGSNLVCYGCCRFLLAHIYYGLTFDARQQSIMYLKLMVTTLLAYTQACLPSFVKKNQQLAQIFGWLKIARSLWNVSCVNYIVWSLSKLWKQGR